MPSPTHFVASGVVLLLTACGAHAPPKLPATPDLPAGQLLAFPHADAQSLLGREVTPSASGGFRIAEERTPGCDVVVRKVKAGYHAVRETKTSDLASIGGGYEQLLSLQATYGKESRASIEFYNAEIFEADVRGSCGRRVVSKVFVGHGKRRVSASMDSSGNAKIGYGGASVNPKFHAGAEGVDELAWSDDQAYAFDVRDFGEHIAEPPAVDVKLPSIVTEGEDVTVSFASAKPTWLVVYYVDSDENAEVLWPSNEEPAPNVQPGAPLTLPSAAERAAGIHVRPTLSKRTSETSISSSLHPAPPVTAWHSPRSWRATSAPSRPIGGRGR